MYVWYNKDQDIWTYETNMKETTELWPISSEWVMPFDKRMDLWGHVKDIAGKDTAQILLTFQQTPISRVILSQKLISF